MHGRTASDAFDANDPTRKLECASQQSRMVKAAPRLYPLTDPFWSDILQSGPWVAETK